MSKKPSRRNLKHEITYIQNRRCASRREQTHGRYAHTGGPPAHTGHLPVGPAHRCSGQGRGGPGRQSEGGHTHSRGFGLRQRPRLQFGVGHGVQTRHERRCHRLPSACHHYQCGGRRVGGKHRPLRDARDARYASGAHTRGDCQPRESGRCDGYGWRRLPHVYQTLSAAHGQSRMRDTQRRGVRTLHHLRLPAHDGARP